MRLLTLTNWAYGVTVFLTLTSGAAMLLASNAQEHERATVAQREQLDQFSSKVPAEVMALSNQAREYAITGSQTHLEVYRKESKALSSIEDRLRHMKDIGADEDELSTIADAMQGADALRDEQATGITARERGDEDGSRRILFGADYERQLDRVANDIERFQYRLDQRTDAEVEAATHVAKIWKTSSEIVLGITCLLVLCVLYFVFKRRVLHPVVRLSDVVTRLAAQDFRVEPPVFDDIDEIGDMAQAISVFRENGIERLRLEQERNSDLAARSLLSRMTQRMQECETTSHVQRVIESFVPEIAKGFAGKLYLFDERRNVVVETCSWLAPRSSAAEFSPSSCWALQRGELHRPRGTAVDVPCDHLSSVDEATTDSICLPLIAHRVTLGLLYLEPQPGSTERASEVSETYLKMLAENIGLAVGNLRLRDTLRDMAMADPLTGLSNRRRLKDVLEARLAEAERAGEPISCIMVDVDHFKRFNDTFGHDAGDAVLRAVGELLRHATRGSDFACRYGGEEFLVLTPRLGAADAARRAEELRSRIGMLRIEHSGQDLGPITASFGVATAPAHCAFDRLISTADAALLLAKEGGRDRVVITERRFVSAVAAA